MTIAFTNIVQPSTKAADLQIAKSSVATQSKTSTAATSERKFDDYLTSASTEKPVTAYDSGTEQAEAVERIDEVMAAETLEDVSDVIDLPIDEQTLLVPVGPEGKLVPIDELMNLEDIAALLQIDVAELEQMLTELVQQDVQLESVWDVLTLVDEQAPQLMAQLTAALQGETKLTPKEVEQVVQFLKVVETLAPKTDLTWPQEKQVANVKELLQTLHAAVKELVQREPEAKPVQQVTLPFQQVTNFQQKVVEVVEPVVKPVQVTSATTATPITSTVETEQPINVTQQQQAPKVQTITVTLPATNQSAQSEALAKEMQAIIQRQQIANQQGTLKLAIKLYPENLGTVRLELMHKDGLLTARLMASTAVGKEMLESQLQQLKQGLAAQNIQIDRIDVTQSLQDASRNMNSSDQHLFNNFFQREQQQEQEEEQVEEQPSFEEFLDEMKEGEA